METLYTFEDEAAREDFRVSIFGSARTQPGDEWYQKTFELAKALAHRDIDVVTGGGPGLMQAGNEGHKAGNVNGLSQSIGLTIELPFEAEGNSALNLRKHFRRFSGRLDQFMQLSHAVVVMPGGIGTCLELFYTWQLVQVKHICNIPIILFGDMWKDLLVWVQDHLVKDGLINPEDMNMVCVAEDQAHALRIIDGVHKAFQERDGDYCINIHKYT